MIPFNDENLAKIRKVADTLQGTSKSLDDVLQEVFEDPDLDLIAVDTLLLHELDNQVMECQACNWWCETHELDDDQICGDCREGTDDE